MSTSFFSVQAVEGPQQRPLFHARNVQKLVLMAQLYRRTIFVSVMLLPTWCSCCLLVWLEMSGHIKTWEQITVDGFALIWFFNRGIITFQYFHSNCLLSEQAVYHFTLKHVQSILYSATVNWRHMILYVLCTTHSFYEVAFSLVSHNTVKELSKCSLK